MVVSIFPEELKFPEQLCYELILNKSIRFVLCWRRKSFPLLHGSNPELHYQCHYDCALIPYMQYGMIYKRCPHLITKKKKKKNSEPWCKTCKWPSMQQKFCFGLILKRSKYFIEITWFYVKGGESATLSTFNAKTKNKPFSKIEHLYFLNSFFKVSKWTGFIMHL